MSDQNNGLLVLNERVKKNSDVVHGMALFAVSLSPRSPTEFRRVFDDGSGLELRKLQGVGRHPARVGSSWRFAGSPRPE